MASNNKTPSTADTDYALLENKEVVCSRRIVLAARFAEPGCSTFRNSVSERQNLGRTLTVRDVGDVSYLRS